MKIIKGFVQQGDVMFFEGKIDKTNKIEPKQKGYVLAEGETTGHAHVLDRIEGVSVFQHGEEFHVETKAPVKIIHEEHKVQEIVTGIVKILKQYNPWTKLLEKTKD
jgi:hypothetical protein